MKNVPTKIPYGPGPATPVFDAAVAKNLTTHRAILTGVQTWTVPANTVKINIFVQNALTDGTTVTITDTDTNSTGMYTGEVLQIGNGRSLIVPFDVDTTDAADNVIISWQQEA